MKEDKYYWVARNNQHKLFVTSKLRSDGRKWSFQYNSAKEAAQEYIKLHESNLRGSLRRVNEFLANAEMSNKLIAAGKEELKEWL